METGAVIAGIGVSLTVLGCAVSVGLVLGKVSLIEEIRKNLADLVKSNHTQDLTLARITEHLGITPHATKYYESK